MTTHRWSAAELRAAGIRERLARRRIVFVQCGAAFSPIRDELIEKIGGRVVTASALLDESAASAGEEVLIVSDIESFVDDDSAGRGSLGSLRERAIKQIDSGGAICLISLYPRVSFPAVPGSSILEDASFHCIPLLDATEIECETSDIRPGERIPAVRFCSDESALDSFYRSALSELGAEVLVSLDRALFEAQLRDDNALEFLDARELEALRGSGLVTYDSNDRHVFTVQNRLGELCDALADVLSTVVEPQPGLAAVTRELWFTERTIRARVRSMSIATHGPRWRSKILTGDLPAKVLERARGDAYVGAASIRELRDPLEWLSLGELLEIVRSKDFNGLGLDAVVWRRFCEDVLPIRNRISHMRLLKRGDRETMTMWAKQIRRRLG